MSRSSFLPPALAGALGLAALLSSLGLGPASGSAQVAQDLRGIHERAAFSTVRIETRAGALGTGWLLAQNVPRPVVITNQHVVERAGAPITVMHYVGSSGGTVETAATVQWVSRSIDLAIIRLDADPPASARALTLESGDLVRGERVVLGGNPGGLLFQTTEGVITGHFPAGVHAASRCGAGRNCVVVDAASFGGSSGGPAINARGNVVGMLWGGPRIDVQSRVGRLPAWMENPAFAFLIHVRTIEQELRAYGESRRARDAGPRDEGEPVAQAE